MNDDFASRNFVLERAVDGSVKHLGAQEPRFFVHRTQRKTLSLFKLSAGSHQGRAQKLFWQATDVRVATVQRDDLRKPVPPHRILVQMVNVLFDLVQHVGHLNRIDIPRRRIAGRKTKLLLNPFSFSADLTLLIAHPVKPSALASNGIAISTKLDVFSGTVLDPSKQFRDRVVRCPCVHKVSDVVLMETLHQKMGDVLGLRVSCGGVDIAVRGTQTALSQSFVQILD